MRAYDKWLNGKRYLAKLNFRAQIERETLPALLAMRKPYEDSEDREERVKDWIEVQRQNDQIELESNTPVVSETGESSPSGLARKNS